MKRKFLFGIKQLEPDPWETLMAKYPVGSKHMGIARNLTNFGVFVELEPGVDGLVHISDLSWTKKIRHPGEVVKKNEKIEVVVLSLDL
jgi:Ribosomal protein S1